MDNQTNENNKKNKLNFYPLSPKNNIKNNSVYEEALKWAIESEEIKNIAVTGPYGAGKSSVLQTFKKKYNKNYETLEISIANFNELQFSENEHSDNSDNISIESSLEQSILQQLFYNIDSKKIPNSRFKRIKVWNKLLQIINVNLWMILLYAVLFFIFNNKIYTFYKDNQHFIESNLWVMLVMFLALHIIIIYLLIDMFRNVFSKFQVSKFSFANTTIENTTNDTSIFDKYMDEIFYFFEVTDINVVIFEDLDRFNSILIFERLRELNLLLNNAENINRKITFIYSTKDDIFENSFSKSFGSIRAKFFDFIIPVLPVINSSNSVEQFKKLFSGYDYFNRFDKSLLNTTALYINDMRLLLNIHNEFLIYLNSLSGISVDVNKLLSFIIFKNIYPKEFAEFQQDKGVFYEILNGYNMYFVDIENSLKNHKKINEELINNIKNEMLNDVSELNHLYKSELFDSQNVQILIDGKYYSISSDPDELFAAILEGSNFTYYNSTKNINRQVNKTELLTIFETKENYVKRKNIIDLKTSGKLETIFKEITSLNDEINRIHYLSVAETLNYLEDENIIPEDLNELPLLRYLLMNGFIDETFNYYITYFYPGTLTKSDTDFIMSVKNKSKNKVEKLDNIAEIMNSLNLSEMSGKEILHADFIEYVFKSDNELFKQSLSKNLLDESDESIKFLSNYLNSDRNIVKLIEYLASYSDGFWVICHDKVMLTKNKLNQIIYLLFENLDVDKLTNQKGIIDYIIDNIKDISNNINNETLVSYFKKNNRKITSVEGINNVFLSDIKSNDLYSINANNIKILFPNVIRLEDILNIELERLNYLLDNITDLIENVILRRGEILGEVDVNLFNIILKHENNSEMIKQVIEKKLCNSVNLDNVPSEKWRDIVKVNKVRCDWNNFFLYYDEFGLDEALVSWLNQKNIFNKLYSLKDNISDELDFDKIKMLSQDLFKDENIDNKVIRKFKKLLIPTEELDIQTMSIEKLDLLIKARLIKFNQTMYVEIEHYNNKLLIDYVMKNIDNFMNELSKLKIDDYIFNELFKRKSFTTSNKLLLIHKILEDQGITESETADNIINYLIDENLVLDQYEKIDYLELFKYGATELSLKLLLSFEELIDNTKLYEYLKVFDYPYNNININGKKVKLVNDDLNKLFAKKLLERRAISTIKIEKEEILSLNMKRK